MKMCSESRKYIIGNILFQWAELIINAVMTGLIAMLVEGLYEGNESGQTIGTKMCVLIAMLILRWFTTKAAIRMSYLS